MASMSAGDRVKRILLIGDSIRMSYNARVTELLFGKAEVWGPEENCRFAKYTLWNIDRWLDMDGRGRPDVIHWNNGIWDTFRLNERVEPFTNLFDYLRDMELVYNEMAFTGAQILFATTTPVGRHFLSDNNERIDRYNAAITEFMNLKGVPINNLNALLKADADNYLQSDLLHLNETGVEIVSQQVAGFIAQYL